MKIRADQPPLPGFGGETFDPELDAERLGRQMRRVVEAMGDTEWHTLAELSRMTGDPEASISARIRDLRKPPRYWLIERERIDHGGQWRYRLVGADPNRERKG